MGGGQQPRMHESPCSALLLDHISPIHEYGIGLLWDPMYVCKEIIMVEGRCKCNTPEGAILF